jgi:hypothetical protein
LTSLRFLPEQIEQWPLTRLKPCAIHGGMKRRQRRPRGTPTPTRRRLLPEVLSGVSLVRESQWVTVLVRHSDALDAMLGDLCKTLADFTLAGAYSPTGSDGDPGGRLAHRRSDTDKLLPAFAATAQASSTTTLTITETSIGDRAVTQIGAPRQLTQGPLYAFARDDIVLFVPTPDPKLSEEALAAVR